MCNVRDGEDVGHHLAALGRRLQRQRDRIVGERASLHDILLGPVRADHAGDFCERTVREPGTGSRVSQDFLEITAGGSVCQPRAQVA